MTVQELVTTLRRARLQPVTPLQPQPQPSYLPHAAPCPTRENAVEAGGSGVEAEAVEMTCQAAEVALEACLHWCSSDCVQLGALGAAVSSGYEWRQRQRPGQQLDLVSLGMAVAVAVAAGPGEPGYSGGSSSSRWTW